MGNLINLSIFPDNLFLLPGIHTLLHCETGFLYFSGRLTRKFKHVDFSIGINASRIICCIRKVTQVRMSAVVHCFLIAILKLLNFITCLLLSS